MAYARPDVYAAASEETNQSQKRVLETMKTETQILHDRWAGFEEEELRLMLTMLSHYCDDFENHDLKSDRIRKHLRDQVKQILGEE